MSERSNPAVIHHFLPKFYLKPWVGPDGKLWRYTVVETEMIHEREITPAQTGYEKHLYSVEPELPYHHPPREDQIETDVFGPIDNAAAVVHRKIVSQGLEALSADDKQAWSLFLNSLTERHPSKVLERDRIIEETNDERVEDFLSKSISPESRERMADVLRDANTVGMAKNVIRTMMVRDIHDRNVIDHFKSRKWEVFTIEGEMKFWTSDAPLLVNCGKDGPIECVTISLSRTNCSS